jgi:fucose 4-O-acetylase-like acetyltransferase
MEGNVSRVPYIDIAKGIAIILVVVGHSTTSKVFVNFIYLFHMPLFIFLSGYLFKDEYALNPRMFIKNRVRKLYFPFLKYELILILLHNTLLNWNIYDQNLVGVYNKSTYIRCIVSVLTFRQTEPMAFTFWFLASLFTIQTSFCLIVSVK